MKRLLSLLVVIAMVVSMIPSVFAAKEEIDMDELLGRLVVLEDISLIEVKLAEGSDGMIYQWTPAADEEATELNLSWYPETAVLNVTATTGENTVSATTTEGFGELTLPIVAGQLVEIVISEANSAAAEGYIYGALSGYPMGSETNPIPVNGPAAEVAIEKASWFQLYYTGDVVISGEGAFNVLYEAETIAAVDGKVTIAANSSRWTAPTTFQIDAAGTYTITFIIPVGSMENPAALVIGDNVADIKAGSQGYFFTWTATEEGTLKITMPAGAWTYQLHNLTTSSYGEIQASDNNPVVNPAEIAVAAGDEIQLIVNTYDPAAPWEAPAGQLTIKAELVLPEPPAPQITITKQPENIICEPKASCALTVEAEGEGLTYQWYRQEPGATTWIVYKNKTAATCEFTAEKSNQGRQYKCVITDANGNSVETVVVSLSMRYIAKQPAPGYMKEANDPVSFSVEYSRPEGAKYQWQYKYSTADDTAWKSTSQTGNKTNTLTFKTTNLKDQYQFRCKITDADGTVTYSDVANLWIGADAPTIKSATAGQLNVVQGYYTFMTVEAEGVGVRYRWQISTNGGESWAPVNSSTSAKTNTLRIIAYAYRSGYQYKCVVSTPNGSGWNKVETDVITLNVLPAVDVIEQPQSAEVAKGEIATFSVKVQMPECEIMQDGQYQIGDGSVITYQWQRSKTGKTWKAIAGETGETLSLEANETNASYYYRCVITNDSGYSGGSIKSDSAQLIIVAE